MKRIAVIGCGGAGKSTLSRQISSILSIPVYHLDKFFWKPGWIETDKEEWSNIVKKLAHKEKWIIDGNYSKTLDIRLEEADTIIFMNISTVRCLYRIIKRVIMYKNKQRPDMAGGCPEKIDFKFLKWILTYNKKVKPTITSKLNGYSYKRIIVLNNPREVKAYIEKLKSEYYQ